MSRRWNLLGKVAVLGAAPAGLLADTALAVLRGWELRSRLDHWVVCFAMSLLLATCAAVMLPFGRKWLHRWGARMSLLVVALVVAMGVGEAGLRICLTPVAPPSFHSRRPGTRFLFRPLPGTMPGIVGESRFTVNSSGIRGTEIPPRTKACRILCVGGSTTECGYLDDEETWPHLLMQTLNQSGAPPNIWVGNLGISGYSTQHHLKFVEDSSLIQEVDCVVLLVGVNDFDRHLRRRDGEGWYVDWRDPRAPLWRRSMFVRLLRTVRDRYVGARAEDLAGQNYQVRRRLRRQGVVHDQLPDLAQGLAEYQQRLEGIIQAIRRQGALPIFLTQPTLWDAELSPQARDLLWFGRMDSNERYLSVPKLREGMDRYNQVLRMTCQELEVTCIDLRSMNGKGAFYYDDCHFNEAGAREVARIITPAIAVASGREAPRGAATRSGLASRANRGAR